MKVLHVISDQNIGGAGILLCNLLRHFEEDIQSIVALPRGSALEERVAELGIQTIPLTALCDRFSRRSVGEIRNWIDRVGADLLHANAALSARVAGRAARIPVVYTRHCCYPPMGAERIPMLRHVARYANRQLCDCAIATADAAATDLLRMGIPRARIRVIINGSDAVREVTQEERMEFLSRVSLTKEDFLVGICARLEACKGQDTFLLAAREVLDRSPRRRIRFLLVGEGSEMAALRAKAESLGISDAVRFTGFVRDMAPVFRSLHLNVNCSRGTETSSLSLSEGMSAGLPAIVSDYGGNAAMLADGQSGIVYPAEDWHALADAICRVAEDEKLEKTMRKAAQARFEAHYTAVRMAKEVGDLYRDVVRSVKTQDTRLRWKNK